MTRSCLFASLALAFVGVARADCPTQTASVAPGLATARDVAYLGEDFGQTFVARDSFLTHVTLWQPAGTDTLPVPITFLLYDTNASGVPLRSPLRIGPTVTIAAGNSAGPVAVDFEFAPAIRLPHLGSFQVAFRTDCAKRLWLLECGGNPFSDGFFQWNRAARCPPWSHGRSRVRGRVVRPRSLALDAGGADQLGEDPLDLPDLIHS
jgi:hypothetical protein